MEVGTIDITVLRHGLIAIKLKLLESDGYGGLPIGGK